MTYSTKDIWPGIYGSYQRCLEAPQRLNLIDETEATDIDRAAYVELLQYRLKTVKRDKREVVQQQPRGLTARDAVSALSVKPGLPAFLTAVESLAQWMTSHAVVFITHLGALSIQIHHVAHLVYCVSQNDSLALGYVFGSVSEVHTLTQQRLTHTTL